MTPASIDVILTRLDTLCESNKDEHNVIRLQIEKISVDHEKRIRSLEDWKLQFVAKFSVYASIGVFLGTLAAQLVIKYLPRFN